MIGGCKTVGDYAISLIGMDADRGYIEGDA